MPIPDVSVVLVTYNHEKYVAQAIESVLAQQTRYCFEFLISEDCSTDRTREVIYEFQRKDPERIRLFLSDRNLKDRSVLTRAWTAARGRYIAFLEGDDCWNDPLKLEKQVGFLERHPDIFVCGHAVRVIDEQGCLVTDSLYDIHEDRYLSPEDLVLNHCIPTLSWVFRNNKILPPYKLFNEVYNGDTLLLSYYGNFGAGYVSHEVMGVYRIHPGGVWSRLSERQQIDCHWDVLSRIPSVLDIRLRAIGYYGLIYYSIFEEYDWWRRIRTLLRATVMMVACLRPRSAGYLARRVMKRLLRRR